MYELDYSNFFNTDVNSKLFEHGLVIVRNAHNLSVDEFEKIGERLGKNLVGELHVANSKKTVQVLSKEETFGDGDLPWHNDWSYGKGDYHGTMLYNVRNAHLSPTWFIDMSKLPEHFYEDYKDEVGHYLPPQELLDNCFTDVQRRYLQKLKITRPFVFDHYITNERVLYCSPCTVTLNSNTDISGIINYAEQHSYKHEWQDGDLLIWDNIKMMHKRVAFEGDRMLWRIQFWLKKTTM